MANNESVEKFRRLTKEMQKEVFDDAVSELNRQADGLVNAMKRVVARGKTAHLAGSIRKVQGPKPTIVRIVAGGVSTRRQSMRSGDFDYARAVEFGTLKMHAEPFFFPTYRLLRKKMRSSMKRKISATINKRSAE
jgi:HK97 gp10 family phage protein